MKETNLSIHIYLQQNNRKETLGLVKIGFFERFLVNDGKE